MVRASVVRNVSQSVACLLMAGAAAVALVGTAVAQSSQNQPSSGGLILPGSVQPGQSGAAAGTIQPNAPAAPQAAPQQPRPQQAAPAPQRPQQAAPAAGPQGGQQQGGQQQARPAQPAKPAAPSGNWEIGPEVFSDGSFRICVAEAKFDNGLVLGLLRNPAKRVNLIVGVPGGNLPPGVRFDARVKVDGKLDKPVPAMVTNPEILTVNIATDESIPAAIGAGNVLTIEMPGEALAFQLRGTSKALNDLSTCVDQAMAGQLQLPPPPPMMPPQLAQLLVEAGLKDAQALPVDKMPPDRRPGEFAWRIGESVLGAIERFPVDPKVPGVAKVSEDYFGVISKACNGTFTPTEGKVETLRNGEIVSRSATCQNNEGTAQISIVFQLISPPPGAPEGSPKQLNVFSHRGPTESKSVVETAAAGIMKALKERADRPPPQAQPQGQQPQGQTQGQR